MAIRLDVMIIAAQSLAIASNEFLLK